jgi:ATP-binding cassette subfamily F protein uup
MEHKILQAEDAVAACQAAMHDPAVVSDAAALQLRCEALDVAHAQVEQLYARWTALEKKRGQSTRLE